jgi:hypothetical protein
MKKIVTFVVTSLLVVTTMAQYQEVSIPGSQLRNIKSTIVGQEYTLHILLPGGYEKESKKYPVVYLMDSQWDFPLAKSIYGQQYFDGFIPEMIIVGVTWGGINPNPDSLRVRDYTPTNDGRQKQSGGADQFLSFMKEELFPFIEKNYRADAENRTLMGCSLGGLITLYALFTHTDMFSGYVAASPAIGWNKEVIYKYEQQYFENRNAKPARLYLSIGGVERNVPGFEKFSNFLVNRKYEALHIKPAVLENTGHSGTKSETFGRGLQYIFERPSLKLSAAILNKYSGIYESVNGTRVEIKFEADKLALYFSPGNRYLLNAASPSDFYSTAEFLNLHFEINNEEISGLKLNGYGRSEYFKKAR